MRIKRTTTRSSKEISNGSNAYFAHGKTDGVIRFTIADDNLKFNQAGMERFIVMLTAEEVRRLVLQVPAGKLIGLLGQQGSIDFAETLAKVLAIEPSGY